MDLPAWHEAGLAPGDVVCLVEIKAMPGAPGYDALRSYSTGRREHALLGPMPAAVARIANRRVWLKVAIEDWLTCPIPRWQRTRTRMARWIEAGRPRELGSGDEPTMPSDHGPSPATPDR